MDDSVEMTIKFASPQNVQTEAEKIANVKAKLDSGFISKSDAIAELDGISKEQAIAKLEEIKAESLDVNANQRA